MTARHERSRSTNPPRAKVSTPLVTELADEFIPVVLTSQVLGFNKQAHLKWRARRCPTKLERRLPLLGDVGERGG